ncbi:hypothetical protein HY792_02475 [Candidatus Desantisbacteria bacterium]|nr:hypothetical protein [Candidatus Desantisbacteria bacterium]
MQELSPSMITLPRSFFNLLIIEYCSHYFSPDYIFSKNLIITGYFYRITAIYHVI